MTSGTLSPVRVLLLRLMPRLAEALARQRSRGRAPSTDLLAAMLIEEGEADGLLDSLVSDLRDPPTPGTEVTWEPLCGPMLQAADRFHLDTTGEVALALALGVEIDGGLARLVGFLNDHPGHTRPTLALLWDVAEVPLGRDRIRFLETPAIRDGLLELVGDGPLSTREIRVAREMVFRLVDDHRHDRRLMPPGPALADLTLPDDVRVRVRGWLEAARRGILLPLLLEGPAGSGRTTLARAILGELGLSAVRGPAPARELRRDARWYEAGIVSPPPPEPADWWAELAGVEQPVAIVVPVGGAEAVRATMAEEPATVMLGVPDTETRCHLWTVSAVGKHLAPGEPDQLAARFAFTPGRIRRAADRAAAESWAPGLLHRICRDMGASSMGGLARRLPATYRREDLILPENLERELALALSWVQHRKQVLGDWNLGTRLANGWGLTMLLAGPPGTGKTMAAQVVGLELDADVYRVDLSQVVSKYIGETEKHLGALLDEASASGAVLLFDEADVLFGRRSEVRDAHDRYANLEVGFLLQRIEDHDGIVLLSTNRFGDMDEAFHRRFQFVLTLPLPDAPLRQRIWQGLLPWVACGDNVDVADLAERFALSGGEIRNAVLAAAFAAAADGVPIGQAQLLRAVEREVRKSGRILRPSERG